MEKNEHAILLDIPSGGKNGKYHSAVLTTYAIDLIHFDNQLLNIHTFHAVGRTYGQPYNDNNRHNHQHDDSAQ